MAATRQRRTRGISIAHLRRWLLAGMILLVVILVGVLGYARYHRARRFLADLPHQLGIDVRSETNGFTYSQTIKGRTIYTIHAAKAIQRENGKTTLHNVAITVYGPPGSNRTDTISGAEFEYDQPNGVIKALGETHLDLALPTPAGAQPKRDAKRAQVTTSGLIFLQKLGVAATDQSLHLVYGDIRGDATGADYDSDTGLMRLRSDVLLDGVQNGRAIHAVAAAAEIDRISRLVTLYRAFISESKDRVTGDTVVLAVRKDGSVGSLSADGHTSVENDKGMHAEAPHLHAQLSTLNRLETAAMQGGAKLKASNGTGSASNATIYFDAAGNPSHVLLQHTVELHTQQNNGHAASRLMADTVDANVVQEGRQAVLRDAVATGNAEFQTAGESTPSNGTRKQFQQASVIRTTVVRAATLKAQTAFEDGRLYISAIDGTGGTRIEQRDSLGNQRNSTGNTLHLTLAAPGSTQRNREAGTVLSATQTGHVAITQHSIPFVGPTGQQQAAQDSHAMADRADFEANSQHLLLTGSPVVTTPEAQCMADRIVLDQQSGDMEAAGDVRSTFAQKRINGNISDPVHILADRAELAGRSGLAHFNGELRSTRMWSSTGQLQAAQIDMDRATGTLTAHAANNGTVRPVHLTLSSTQKSSGLVSGKQSDVGPTDITGDTVQMISATATVPGHIDVSGRARLVRGTTEITSEKLAATLRPAVKSNDAVSLKNIVADVFSQGNVDTITASDHVYMRQAGRTGTGKRLLYTAKDDQYQLTGIPSMPPRITDSLHGTVTGAVLNFYGGDQSIQIAGKPGSPVHTEAEAARPAHSR